jgi:hypothetical protein
VDIFTSRMNKKPQGVIGRFDQSGLFHAGDDPDDYRMPQIRPDTNAGNELNPTSWAPPIYPIRR